MALTIPGLVLCATALGFGALARDLGFSAGQAVFISAVVYATPAQVVLIDLLSRGAALSAVALAVTLTAVRLLPMTVTLMPYLRDHKGRRWREVLAAHFIAITAWVEGSRRLPPLPDHLRLSHFLGIGTGMVAATGIGTLAGYVLAATLPSVLSAALLFLTPIYFLSSLMVTARNVADWFAIGLGLVMGPVFFVSVPGFDLLATGLIGGTLAYAIGRRHR